MADLKIGDVVKIKSGGPTMTIENIGAPAYSGSEEHTHAWCQWFDKTVLKTGVFPLTSLDAAK